MFTIKTFKIKFYERLKYGYDDELEIVWLSNHTTILGTYMFPLNHSIFNRFKNRTPQ